MDIHCVIAEYRPKENAVAEYRVKIVHTIEDAEKWINKEVAGQPAMFYIDGMQDLPLETWCVYSDEYWKEHRKVID